MFYKKQKNRKIEMRKKIKKENRKQARFSGLFGIVRKILLAPYFLKKGNRTKSVSGLNNLVRRV